MHPSLVNNMRKIFHYTRTLSTFFVFFEKVFDRGSNGYYNDKQIKSLQTQQQTVRGTHYEVYWYHSQG